MNALRAHCPIARYARTNALIRSLIEPLPLKLVRLCQPCTAEKVKNRSVDHFVIRSAYLRARHEDRIEPAFQYGPVGAAGFTESAFYPVALYGVSQLLADGETDPSSCARRPRVEHHQRMHNRALCRINALEISVLAQTLVAGQQNYTVRRCLPRARRALRTLRPSVVIMRLRKPCTRLCRRFFG